MATYTAGCTAVGSFSYAGNFTLYVKLTESGINTATNTSNVEYKVYCQSSGSGSINATHWKYFALNGQQIVNETVNVNVSSPNAYISIAEGTMSNIPHEADGSRWISFEAIISASRYGVSASVSGNFTLTTIDRYAYFSKHELNATGLTNIDIKYRPDRTISAAQYSLNNGSWTNLTVISGTWNNPNNDVVYRISNLNPNTTYSVRTRIQYNNNLWTTATAISAKTKDIARLSDISAFELGDNKQINYTNASGSAIAIGIFKDSDLSELCSYRSCSDTSYTFNFTDTELDAIYQSMDNTNQLSVRVILKTANTYTDYKVVTVNLTGNQKTGHIKISDSWKRTKRWINVNGTWKRAVRWININGTWKRCI